MSPTTFSFLSDHISPDCLNKPESFEVETDLDTIYDISTDDLMQSLQTVAVIKSNEFPAVLNYIERQNSALEKQEQS